MNLTTVYQWRDEITRHFLSLSRPQVGNLALFSLGVIAAGDCRLARVADEWARLGNPDSIERRLQRVLSNPALARLTCQPAWARWVVCQFSEETLVVVVDETKLGKHLGTMLVGMAYRQRCIPLMWRCYRANSAADYPSEGQVQMIVELLTQLAQVLPSGTRVCVQADQGIGTSPTLMRAVQGLGWQYLFRIQGTSHILLPDGQDCEVRSLVERGGRWDGRGRLFKGDGWTLAVELHLWWDAVYDQAWYLATCDPDATSADYQQRGWVEQSFRDLKSGGWKWGNSQVWQPSHAERLILVLALAYAWMLSYGTAAVERRPGLMRVSGQRRYPRRSLFRIGLREFKIQVQRGLPVNCHFQFIPKLAPGFT